MFARIGVVRALNRHHVRKFDRGFLRTGDSRFGRWSLDKGICDRQPPVIEPLLAGGLAHGGRI